MALAGPLSDDEPLLREILWWLGGREAALRVCSAPRTLRSYLRSDDVYWLHVLHREFLVRDTGADVSVSEGFLEVVLGPRCRKPVDAYKRLATSRVLTSGVRDTHGQLGRSMADKRDRVCVCVCVCISSVSLH